MYDSEGERPKCAELSYKRSTASAALTANKDDHVVRITLNVPVFVAVDAFGLASDTHSASRRETGSIVFCPTYEHRSTGDTNFVSYLLLVVNIYVNGVGDA